MSYVLMIMSRGGHGCPISTYLGKGVLESGAVSGRPCFYMNDALVTGQGGHSGSVKLSQWRGDTAMRTRNLKQGSGVTL